MRSPHTPRALTALLLLTASAPATADGGFTLPLPAAELPHGALTVKVVGSNLRDLKVGQPVQLLRAGEGGALAPVATVPTGEDGRAHFEGLKAAERYTVQVEADGKRLRSSPFPGPASGGIRLLLSMGGALQMGGQQNMPAGHPPAGMPAGHPPASDRGDGKSGAARLEPDPELGPGKLRVVVLRGKARQPLAGAKVTLSSETTGKKAARQTHALPPTDARGQTTADLGEDRRYTVTVGHQGLSYSSQAFSRPVGAEQGLRATFAVFDRHRDAGKLTLGRGSHWVSQVGEGVVKFMQVMELVNGEDAIIDPGSLELPLPRGARNVEIPAELEGIVVSDAGRRTIRLIAPVPPGSLPLRVFYEVPFRGQTLELSQPLPFALPEGTAVVLLNATDRVRVAGPAVQGKARKVDRGVAYPLTPIDRGKTLEIAFTDLPHRDRRPLVGALVLAGLIGLWALFAALGGPRHARRRREQRERLLLQLVQTRRGKGQKQRGRQDELVRQLKQVWEEPW